MEAQHTNKQLQDLRSRCIAKGTSSANSCYVDHARGAVITDVEGNDYLDFAGGIAVMNVGHSHPTVVQAIKDQAEKFTHTCFMVVPYEAAVTLADTLCAAVPGDSPKAVMFANSGAEAVENAVKIARYHTKRPAIITFDNAFHGRTLMGMTLTSKMMPYKYGLGPFAPEVYRMPYANCYRCPFNRTYPECDLHCADHLEYFFINQVAADQTAAIIFEPIQGEGGFIVPPREYFTRLKSICDRHGILLIADEIQTGIGRTGHLFAMEYFGVEADITTTAKSLAAGLPLSAVVGKKEIMDAVHPGGIGGTYGGNPLACRAALAVFEVIETEGLLKRAKRLGERLQEAFCGFQEKYDVIGDVRGLGPMIAMELVRDRTTKQPAPDETRELVGYCFQHRLMVLACGTYGNVLRFLMPLVITDEQVEQGLAIIDKGLAALSTR
ncbi:4-aminobutyrate--2-oxoglutarate transaminase [Desulfofustis glycolicus]|uniref:4-aminobutyrate aminotransferase apoenzyme n=1 Tax=Desulfofustis glycolicus DSM 9705 TaxID=1121409 RepID=A0A1M5S9Q5_9BACT|nr:4-aminobutyrate--2-oxoglutarate transaminase [Desulfofustis glycolicus]MCB2216196.1 4-aminobutyrate--2-oxoglutarate transaminase [Desulfobulbaceae bacterium]SHH35244.1 4-aminobutyrate aminotransferase apoenzyme [Desulfofustis glycolicus DSM 9705]